MAAKKDKKPHWSKDDSPAGILKRKVAERRRLKTRRRNARLAIKGEKGEHTHGGNKRGPKGSKRATDSTQAGKDGAEKNLKAQLIEERQVGILFGETWKTIEFRARSSRVPVAVLAGRLGRLLLGAASGQVLGA